MPVVSQTNNPPVLTPMDDDNEAHQPIRFPFYEKHQWRQVLRAPNSDWQVGAVWDDAYHRGAKRLIEGVARGEYSEDFEGVAGLYLFRHYLELSIKFLIFHSRWLKDQRTNATVTEIQDVAKTHSLQTLWATARSECSRVMPADEWNAIDIAFVDACIGEFHAIDPNGERFRYHGERFGVEKDPARALKAAKTLTQDLIVDYSQLSVALDHVYDVLNYLNVYMLETHGENTEWARYLESL